MEPGAERAGRKEAAGPAGSASSFVLVQSYTDARAHAHTHAHAGAGTGAAAPMNEAGAAAGRTRPGGAGSARTTSGMSLLGTPTATTAVTMETPNDAEAGGGGGGGGGGGAGGGGGGGNGGGGHDDDEGYGEADTDGSKHRQPKTKWGDLVNTLRELPPALPSMFRWIREWRTINIAAMIVLLFFVFIYLIDPIVILALDPALLNDLGASPWLIVLYVKARVRECARPSRVCASHGTFGHAWTAPESPRTERSCSCWSQVSSAPTAGTCFFSSWYARRRGRVTRHVTTSTSLPC